MSDCDIGIDMSFVSARVPLRTGRLGHGVYVRIERRLTGVNDDLLFVCSDQIDPRGIPRRVIDKRARGEKATTRARVLVFSCSRVARSHSR